MQGKTFKANVAEALNGRGKEGHDLNKVLLVLNILAIFLFLLEPIFGGGLNVHYAEVVIGVIFLIEYIARIWVAEKKLRFVFGLINILDLIVVLSLFAPLLGGNFGFLRIIRAFRILRSFRLLKELSGNHKTNWFAKNEEVLTSGLSLFAFVFIMTDIVYVIELSKHDSINSYLDALYFTLGTLTTTGFGDITLSGKTGQVLSILIMVFGITLFVRLARDIIRPPKVHYQCKKCGLLRHDHDAAHCKHCGNLIRIQTEGDY